jgi:hypothetical protein
VSVVLVSNGVRAAVAGVNLSGSAYSNSLYMRVQVWSAGKHCGTRMSPLGLASCGADYWHASRGKDYANDFTHLQRS